MAEEAIPPAEPEVDACLSCLPGDLLLLVVLWLEQRDLGPIFSTCQSLRELEKEFKMGKQVFPLGPTLDGVHGNQGHSVQIEGFEAAKAEEHGGTNAFPSPVSNASPSPVATACPSAVANACPSPVTKNACPSLARQVAKAVRPGLGTLLGRERLDVHTCYWEARVESFGGVCLEVGVATRAAVARGGLLMSQSWLFDCFGRVRHGSTTRGFGCKVLPGHSVGVLLNTGTRRLSFFLDGVCMGTAFRNVQVPPGVAAGGGGLHPLVVLRPQGEELSVPRWPSSVSFPATSAGLLETKKGWTPPAHPADGRIIVQTYEAQVHYCLPKHMVPGTTTVLQVKEALVNNSDISHMTPGQLALRVGGCLLTSDDMLLSEAGVRWSVAGGGVQLQDLYLYIPHLVS